jgi:hypothetical protein
MPVDTSDFRAAFLELKAAGDGLHIELRRGVKAAGRGALDAVKEAASWSSKIPPATRLKVSFAAKSAGVSVVVNARQAPNARPINHGGKDGVFKHPVWGHRDRRWATQRAHPFINAAGKTPEIDKQIQEVLNRVADMAVGK